MRTVEYRVITYTTKPNPHGGFPYEVIDNATMVSTEKIARAQAHACKQNENFIRIEVKRVPWDQNEEPTLISSWYYDSFVGRWHNCLSGR